MARFPSGFCLDGNHLNVAQRRDLLNPDQPRLPAARAGLRGIIPSLLDPNQTGLLGAACLAWERIPLD